MTSFKDRDNEIDLEVRAVHAIFHNKMNMIVILFKVNYRRIPIPNPTRPGKRHNLIAMNNSGDHESKSFSNDNLPPYSFFKSSYRGKACLWNLLALGYYCNIQE
jgi:hypothetical protein